MVNANTVSHLIPKMRLITRKVTLVFLLVTLPLISAGDTPNTANNPIKSVADIFETTNEIQQLLNIEAALAQAQAELGIIPTWAAKEIARKAQHKYVPLDALATERDKVGHRMVALLNVWQRSLEGGAAEYMHFGATTVDIYDTLLVLQLTQTQRLMIDHLLQLENQLIQLASEHKRTVMIGRTLGQHALPITFGKKVSTWLGENRRNIERLKQINERLYHSAILKGAVGSYLGLGDNAIDVEKRFAHHLGLGTPYADDWHGSRDVFAEYAQTLALISKSLGRVGNELFLLQMTDIGETLEVRPSTAVGSSTMPHKSNPNKTEGLIFYSRTIPRLAEVIVDDMVNYFERDNTSRTNTLVGELSIDAEKMLKTAKSLIASLQVNDAVMKDNIHKTGGLIMSQRLTFALAERIGKTTANDAMHKVAVYAVDNKLSLREALKAFPELAQHFDEEQLDVLFDAETYIGLAAEQVDQVIERINSARRLEQSTSPYYPNSP